MRLYRALLRLYPRAFRDRFGPEMLALFAQDAAAAPRSFAGRLAFWRGTIVDLLRSAARERFPGGGTLSMTPMLSDVRQAWRVLRRAPLLSAFVVVLMALSIGSTTAVFSVVHAVLLRPLPFARPDRLVVVWERRGVERERNVVAGHEYPEWKARSRSFEDLAAVAFDRDYDLTGAGEPMRLSAARVTSGFFGVMGVAPEIGRTFTRDEDEPGHGHVVVLSDRLWRGRFAADPAIGGREVLLSGAPFTVVGVMPARFDFPSGPAGAPPDVWTPIAEPIHRYVGRHYLFVVGRLKDGVTLAQAQDDLTGVAARLERELPDVNHGHGVNVRPLHGELVRGVDRALIVLFCGVALVLAIGCCNVANLLLARAAARQREIAVRLALGASRGRVARQLLAEGATFALLGGAGGMLLAGWLIALARPMVPGDVPRLQDARLDGTVTAFAAGITVLTALVFGLVPLVQVARVQVAERLKHGARGVAASGRLPLRRLLLVVEVAMTVIVATGAGLLLQSFARLLRVDPGFRAEGVVATDVALPDGRYATAANQRAFYDAAMGRLAALPDVSAVSAVNLVPHGAGRSAIAIAIEGRAAAPGEDLSASYRVVTPEYFKTLGIPLLAGRPFTSQDARLAVPVIRWFPQQPLPAGFDRPQAPPVALVNRTMAARFWPGADPLGRRFTVLFSPPITVVGLVEDSRDRALAENTGPEFYLTAAQEPQTKMTLLLRTTAPASSIGPAIRSAIWSIDRDLPVDNARSLVEIVDANLATYRSVTALMAAYAGLALLLMALGVYAVVSYTTAQRSYEMGVRLALGAQRGDIRRLVLVHGAGLTAAGIAIGAVGAYALARFAASLLYEVTPADPLTYAALITIVFAITLAATWGPARRAQRVDPLTVLRSE